jgi:superfamily I DNA/RNA helicase
VDFIVNTENIVTLSQHAKVSLAWRWGIITNSDDVEFYCSRKPYDLGSNRIRVKGHLDSHKNITLIIDYKNGVVCTALPKENGVFSGEQATKTRNMFEKSLKLTGYPTLEKIASYRTGYEESEGDFFTLNEVYIQDIIQHEIIKSSQSADEPLPSTENPSKSANQKSLNPSAEIDDDILDSLLPWIDGDELYYLNIPESDWAAIWRAGSVAKLNECGIEDSHVELINNYMAQGDKSLVEKLYSIESSFQEHHTAAKPLKYFLADLDPEQKKVIQKISNDGPYLIRGSAGTGKSTVGLHRIKDLVLGRTNESLFDDLRPKYGIITYTNVLVDTNRAIFEGLIPDTFDIEVTHTTLDKIARDLANQYAGDRSPLSIDGIGSFLSRYILMELKLEDRKIIERLGCQYVAEEIEHIILGYNIDSQDKYFKQKRTGRKRGLQRHERQAVWATFERFELVCARKRATTYNMRRVMALKQLKKDRDWNRFSALFVDEAQDLPGVARLLCLELVSDSRFLLFAADTAQSIYIVPPTWKETHKDLSKRRPLTLEKSYRATEQISVAINSLRVDPEDEDDVPSKTVSMRDGPKPLWVDTNASQHAEKACEIISKKVFDLINPVNPSQIAIIVREKKRANHFLKTLKSHDIPVRIVGKSSPISVDKEAVHIITAHSSKGLEFPIVIVPDVNDSMYPLMYSTTEAFDELQMQELVESEQRLLYVALSRASSYLYMLADPLSPSRYLSKLSRSEHWM